MNIDPKLSQFKSFLSENKLNNAGVKTTIDHSAVTAGENANVDLNLNSDDGQSQDKKSKKKKKKDLDFLQKKANEDVNVKSEAEVKALNLKLLNLL
ncbi:MAG: hypothetical protein H7177_05930 [Rhizobacter sp.]|nr:hypothetical protein [Bacteriovorax sp.]